MHACECTPGGSLTTAAHRRPGAIVGIKECLRQENRNRKVMIYAFPLEGGHQSNVAYCAKHRNKTRHLGESHFMCYVVARYAADRNMKVADLWRDSVHPTKPTQEYLRTFGISYAEVWTRAAGKVVPSAEGDPLIIVIGDGWNKRRAPILTFGISLSCARR